MRAYKSMDMPAKRHHEQMQTGDATGLDMPWHAYTNKNTHRFACYSMLALDLASHYCIVYSQLLQVHARTHARTHRLTYTLARTQADNTRTHARAACSRVQTHTHKHNTQARYAHRQPTHADTHTHAHAHVLARARAHTHTHTHIQGTVSHKKMAVDTNWLLKIYYHNQLVLFLCCLLNETFFVM